MDLVVLSPHLDDAIFSIGGQLAAAVAAGRRVLVATFGTHAPPAATIVESLRPFLTYPVRLAEDERACASLGVERRALGYVERVLRHPPLTSLRAVFTTPPDVAGFDCLGRMQQTVRALGQEFPAAQIYAPLGVGNHFDHVEVFLAAARELLAQRAFERFAFYEDAYALGLAARRRHLVTRTRLWPWRGAPEHASVRAWALFRALALGRRGPPVERYLPALAELRWTQTAVDITAHEQAKLQAVHCYPSQLEMLGGAAGWAAMLGRYHRVWGLAEPLWRAAPAPRPQADVSG